MTDVTPIYRKHSPVVEAIPVVVSMPHSGMHVPSEIDQLFTEQQRNWLRNTDWYLPQLYDFLVDLGVTVIEATHSRYVVDLNRDPAGDLFGEFRSAVIAKENDHGDAVYAVTPNQQSLMQRLARYHAPYHNALDEVLNAVADRFGSALLLDLHSFMGPIDNDVCLGDRGGISCAPEITAAFQRSLGQHGFDVVSNAPFSGGFIVRSHARPPRVHALQIELRYTTYLDCANIDAPGIPSLDPARMERARVKLRPALEDAIGAVIRGGLLQRSAEVSASRNS